MSEIPTICKTKATKIENFLPFASESAGNPNIPITAPKAYIDCIADLIDFLSQYNLLYEVAVKELITLQFEKSTHAYNYVVGCELHYINGFMNMYEPIIAEYVICIHMKHINVTRKYW